MESFDLVIIGAGIHGISMLKTYHHVCRDATILLIEKNAQLGGVWSADNLYPTLQTNNHFSTFEFGDFPMNTEGFNLADDHIPGEVVNKYLQDYVNHFNIFGHIRFNSSVDLASDNGPSGWILTVSDLSNEPSISYQVQTTKLVVATGLTSTPHLPAFQGQVKFNAPIYHTTTLPKAHSNTLGPYKAPVVLGGAKFSWDIAYAYASSGTPVNWVIRKSGHGPCWMIPNRLTPLRIIPELLITTRLVTWLNPSSWGDADGFSWIRKFFHGTWFGRKIVGKLFTKMQHGIEENLHWDTCPETAKLRPWNDMFFIGTNRGLLNYKSDYFQLVRDGMIRIHIADISHLDDHKVVLDDGAELDADVLVCGTGWKATPPIRFQTDRDLGLPHTGLPAADKQQYVEQADQYICTQFAILANQPPALSPTRPVKPLSNHAAKTKEQREPYRLYRFMVPPSYIQDRTLAFAGTYRSACTTLIAQAQALWITAFLHNEIPHLTGLTSTTTQEPENKRNDKHADTTILNTNKTSTYQDIMYSTVLHTQFGKWRYSRGFGARFPEMWFDSIPYIDMLIRDVGLRIHRKGSWWREAFTPYRPRDYAGIVDEFLGLREKRRTQAGGKVGGT